MKKLLQKYEKQTNIKSVCFLNDKQTATKHCDIKSSFDIYYPNCLKILLNKEESNSEKTLWHVNTLQTISIPSQDTCTNPILYKNK